LLSSGGDSHARALVPAAQYGGPTPPPHPGMKHRVTRRQPKLRCEQPPKEDASAIRSAAADSAGGRGSKTARCSAGSDAGTYARGDGHSGVHVAAAAGSRTSKSHLDSLSRAERARASSRARLARNVWPRCFRCSSADDDGLRTTSSATSPLDCTASESCCGVSHTRLAPSTSTPTTVSPSSRPSDSICRRGVSRTTCAHTLHEARHELSASLIVVLWSMATGVDIPCWKHRSQCREHPKARSRGVAG
jgi:hypothetical protein